MTFLILHLPRKFDFGLKKKKKKTLNHRLLNFWKVSITSYDVWVIFQCKQRGCWRKSLGFQIMVRTGEWEGPAKNGQQMGRRQVMLTWKRCLMDCMDSLFTYHAGLGQCWKHFKEKKKSLAWLKTVTQNQILITFLLVSSLDSCLDRLHYSPLHVDLSLSAFIHLVLTMWWTAADLNA